MNDLKNINTESHFEGRTGLIVWLNSKRSVKRLMNFGLLHYVSKKMDYAIIYVDTQKIEQTMERLKKENYVKSVEESHLRDLPISFDDVLGDLKKEIDSKKQKENKDSFIEDNTLDFTKW